MEELIRQLLKQSLAQLMADNIIDAMPQQLRVNHSKNRQFGDYNSNVALLLAKSANQKSADLAHHIVARLATDNRIKKVAVAGAGFINFYLTDSSNNDVITAILQRRQRFGLANIGDGCRILLEYVSANPTGPLHVGHGRAAAYGSSLANVLKALGFNVESEYYLNDSGRQMDILTLSIWLRYLQLSGSSIQLPDKAYQGDYIIAIARIVTTKYASQLVATSSEIYQGICANNSNPEKHIDDLIQRAKQLLGATYDDISTLGLDFILLDIQDDLTDFGVRFERYFSEKSLVALRQKMIEQLKNNGSIYEKGGALWFGGSHFGDSEDRVAVRENGQATYFASDIAYHFDKFKRRFDRIINIWGADHHGYIGRVKAAMRALAFDEQKIGSSFGAICQSLSRRGQGGYVDAFGLICQFAPIKAGDWQ